MRPIIIILSLLLGLAIYFLWPVYGFFSHNGDAPLPPIGWMTLEGEAPTRSELYDPAFAQAADEAIDAIASFRRDIQAPSFSAAVSVRGKLVWAGTAGWADIARAEPATPSTQYGIGSTSKAITATALARLVDSDIVDLDAPIARYLVELPNEDWRSVTPRMLASHMAGIPHYGDNTNDPGIYHMMALRRHFDRLEDAVALFDGSPLLFPPGTDFEYSSLGTVLLGRVMEAAAGIPYRQLIEREVLDPAGAKAAIVAPKRADPADKLATFYLREGERYRKWRAVDLSHRLPGGGYAATSSDLARIGSLWLDSDFIRGATRREFWTPQVLSSGEVNEQGYGLGWRWREYQVDGVGLARNANHGGVTRGAQSWLLVFPDYDMAVAINMNMRTDEFAEFGMAYRPVFAAFAKALNTSQLAE